MIVRWRGRNGYGQRSDPDRQGEQQRVHRLGDEQVRDPLDVGDDAPALGHHARAAPRTGRRAARSARRRASPARRCPSRSRVGVLQRERVVHAVARHRDDVATLLERGDDRALLVRRDPADDRGRLEQLAQGRRIVGELATVDGTGRTLDADPGRDRADRPRVVARHHLARHALRREVAERLGSRRAGSSRRTSRTPRRRAARASVSPSSGRSVRASSNDPAPGRGELLGPPAHRIGGRPADPHHLRRAEHPRPVRRRTSPRSICGPTRTALRRSASSRRARRRPRATACIVPLRSSSAASAPRAASTGRPSASASSVVEAHRTLGDRARLVEHHDVDARESLDRGQLLHEHPPARQRHRGQREREAREQHQSFGDHRDHAGDRARHRVAEVVAGTR